MILTGNEDLRVKKTITGIKAAFEALICEKEYDRITVKELCQQAGINRGNEKNGYPEPSAHGIQPAWGLSIRHAEKLTFNNVHLETMKHDERKAIEMHNTKKVRFKKMTTINSQP